MANWAKPVSVGDLTLAIYADTANPAEVAELAKRPEIAGFTTNPSLMRKSGEGQTYRQLADRLLVAAAGKPISFEVIADTVEEMLVQARLLRGWHPSIYVKIPVVNSLGQPMSEVIRPLSEEGTSLNLTAIMTPEQAARACEALVDGTDALISVFAGRVADTGRDPVALMEACLPVVRARKGAKLLWASTREVFNLFEANRMGVDIITVPPDMLKKFGALGYDLDRLSVDAARTFHADARSAGFVLEG